MPINVAQAALGASIDLLTFDGLQTVKIPEGSQPGSRLRLKGLGVPHVNGSGRGDLFVHLDVRVPQKLTREQRKLVRAAPRTAARRKRAPEKGIFDKVKDYFSWQNSFPRWPFPIQPQSPCRPNASATTEVPDDGRLPDGASSGSNPERSTYTRCRLRIRAENPPSGVKVSEHRTNRCAIGVAVASAGFSLFFLMCAVTLESV